MHIRPTQHNYKNDNNPNLDTAMMSGLSREELAGALDVQQLNESKKMARNRRQAANKQRDMHAKQAASKMREAAKKSMWAAAMGILGTALTAAASFLPSTINTSSAGSAAATAKPISKFSVLGHHLLKAGNQMLTTANPIQFRIAQDQADAKQYELQMEKSSRSAADAQQSEREFGDGMNRSLSRISSIQQTQHATEMTASGRY